MRNGQNKRMRGRNQHHSSNNNNNNHGQHRKNHNPMSRVFESNGPDVKIRGNPAHIAEKYMQLARDANSSGDPIAAENYYQHAEHYYRLIAAAQEQFRQNNPHLPRIENEMPGGARDDLYEDGEEDGPQPIAAAVETAVGTGEQPYLPRDAQPFPQNPPRPYNQPNQSSHNDADIGRLPSFITGSQQPQLSAPQAPQNFQGQPEGQNGFDGQQGDRFPLHRRRRRHRGPRNDFQGGPRGGDRDDSSSNE